AQSTIYAVDDFELGDVPQPAIWRRLRRHEHATRYNRMGGIVTKHVLSGEFLYRAATIYESAHDYHARVMVILDHRIDQRFAVRACAGTAFRRLCRFIRVEAVRPFLDKPSVVPA